MRLSGILRSWNEARGFGFIAPTHGGGELFVHVSAFPRDGSRPVEGESLSYELGRGKDGRPQAVNVVRQAVGARPPRRGPGRRSATTGVLRSAVVGVLVVACLAYGYRRHLKASPPAAATSQRAPDEVTAPLPGAYRCDGRIHCSQMHSCAEAQYFLKHCPGVKMDGNRDGVPCEQQWCR